MSIVGVITALFLRRFPVNKYTQIGLILILLAIPLVAVFYVTLRGIVEKGANS
jgi:hypothetical protein